MADSTILKGTSRLINPMNVRPGTQVDDIERKMLERGLIKSTDEDPTRRFEAELNKLAGSLGVSLSLMDPKKPVEATPDRFDMDSDFEPRGVTPRTPMRGSMAPRIEDDDDDNDENYRPSAQNAGHTPRSLWKSDTYRPPESGSSYMTPSTPMQSSYASPYGSDFKDRTDEQNRQEIIRDVVGDIGGENSFSLEREKENDLKSIMIEEIDELREILEDEGVDITRIKKVTKDDSYDIISDVLKSLRFKNDSIRYRTMAEEFIMFGAQGMEEIFDGKRVWLSRYRPDLTGWSKQLNSKLRRMRTDTSRVVSGVMKEYDIGPGFRILLELVPNAFMYSRSRKKQAESPSLFNDDEMATHITSIRNAGSE
jgi:hypothetical protein